jgi:hypothetical protein
MEIAGADRGVALVGFLKATFLTCRMELRVFLFGGCLWVAVNVRFLS